MVEGSETTESELNFGLAADIDVIDLVAWIIPKDVLSLCFSTPGIT